MKKCLNQLSLVASLLILNACISKSPQASPSLNREYETLVLQTQNIVLHSQFPATIKGQTDVDIRPRIEGFIEAIYVDEGSVVKKGEKLFLISSPQTDQAMLTSQAAVASAEAAVASADLDVEKTRPLAEKGIVSKYQLKGVENNLTAAKAVLSQAQASLANARTNQGWKTVTSPVDGVVGSLPYRIGNLVNSSNSLTNIASTGNIYANFSINEKTHLHIGTPVQFILSDGNKYTVDGVIKTISGVIENSTGTVNVRAEFSNTEGILRSGGTGKIIIPKELENVLIIPQKATFAIQDKVLTFLVEGDSIAIQKVIEVESTSDGKNFVVNKGLQVGDRIVTDGLSSLKHGTHIKIK